MNNRAEDGFLVLADISGFTAFVTTTELEHGSAVVAELLGEVMRQLSPPLEIQDVEGDAVFAVGAGPIAGRAGDLLDLLEGAFAAFKSRQHQLEADDSCACAACRNIGKLDLKIIAHYGRFLRQRVGDRSQAAGASVVLAHRLLKNGLPARAYILLTEAALRWAGLSPDGEGLLPHLERYEHFGDVRCFVKALESPVALVAEEAGRGGGRDPRQRRW